MPLKVKVVGKTDKGLVRSGNEDYLHLDPANDVYAVCDGMGGHQAGEVASMLASETIRTAFSGFSRELSEVPELDLGRTLPTSGGILVKAIRLANRAIYDASLADSAKTGMGTTVVAMAFEADIASVAHVGDSRAYRITPHGLEPLTRDHSWLEEYQEAQNVSREEASSFIGKNVITRALGVRKNVEVDYRIIKVKPGDMFLLCSDGLCGFADDDEIFDVVSMSMDDIDHMATELIQMANDRGGADNVTVVILQADEVKESPLPELDVLTMENESETVLQAEDRWLERFRSYHEQKPAKQTRSGGGASSNRLVMLAIVVVFIAVALLIIYFSQSQ